MSTFSRRSVIPRFLIGLILVAAASQSVEARSFHWKLDPTVSRSFGHTTYRMDIATQATASGEITALASELEYPLNHTMLGLNLTLSSYLGPHRDWALSVSVQRSVSNPSGTMFDTDWITVVDGYDGKFSYTESSADGNSLILGLRATKRLWAKNSLNLSTLVGMRYQRVTQNIDNFAGWQRDPTSATSDQMSFSVDGTPALEYEVTYVMPHLGAEILLQNSRSLSGAASVALAYTVASDYDDHLLRNKDADGDGTGFGFIGGFSVSYFLKQSAQGARSFIGLDAELLVLNVDGEQTQTWYDDEVIIVGFDPGTGQPIEEILVPAGTVIPDVPHEFSSTQFRLGVRLGFVF